MLSLIENLMSQLFWKKVAIYIVIDHNKKCLSVLFISEVLGVSGMNTVESRGELKTNQEQTKNLIKYVFLSL